MLRLSAGDFSVPANLSEILLRKMSSHRGLTDLTMSIFDGWSMKLNKVEINDASKLTAFGLRFLREHNIQELVSLVCGHFECLELRLSLICLIKLVFTNW